MAGPPEVVTETYRRRYGDTPELRVFRAPGRVNLIGEHTDYNLGFVLPVAIHLACYSAAAPAQDGMFRVYSKNVEQERSWPVGDLGGLRPAHDWSDYLIGVARQLLALGYSIPAMRIALYSTVPVGSGLSSSAAIEVATALTLLAGRPINPTELAKLCQRAEREFVGVPCGIMDQYVSVFGAANKAIAIDCRSITHRSVSLPENVAIVAVNSMVKHELGASAYSERVEECKDAVQSIRMRRLDVQSLRDVSPAELEASRDSMDSIPYRRARHVVTENERVSLFMSASENGDPRRMGELFLQSHRSLQQDYEVSCEELDFLVDQAMSIPGVYGARMTGGGFGGCTVNLVDSSKVNEFSSTILQAYHRRYALNAQVIPCVPDAGASEIKVS